jgi:hypothetical protein
MANLNAVLLLSLFPVLFIGIVSVIAGAYKIPFLSFWALPAGALSPWLFLWIVIIVLTEREGFTSRSQAMGMSSLFPVFGGMLFGLVGTALGFFIARQGSLLERFLWGTGVSSVPAVIMAAVLFSAMRR